MGRIKGTENLLKNADYFFSSDLEEHKRDRSVIIKLLSRRVKQCDGDPSEENLLKFINCLLFMRNIFDKGSVLEYLMLYFGLDEYPVLVCVIYKTLIQRDEGVVLDTRRFALYSTLIEEIMFKNQNKLTKENRKNINNIEKMIFESRS